MRVGAAAAKGGNRNGLGNGVATQTRLNLPAAVVRLVGEVKPEGRGISTVSSTVQDCASKWGVFY